MPRVEFPMPQEFRRVVLKPADLNAQESARLRASLSAAVEVQRQLASDSPHVLRFSADLQEDEHSFFVTHEPAAGIEIDALFDPEAAPANEAQLLRIAASLADALRASLLVR